MYQALKKWTLITQEKMASALDKNPELPHYWSADPRDAIFGAHHNPFSTQFTGFSVCHPIYDDKTMNCVMRHAIFSATINPEAMATFLFLPSWGGPMTIDHYSKLLAAYAHIRCKSATLSDLHYDTPQCWTNQEFPLPQHTWNMRMIAV